MKTELVKLTKQRTELNIAIIVLQDELHDTPIPRKFEIAGEIAYNQAKLYDIERDIGILTLDEQWEQGACDKPKTVILGD